MPPGRARPSDRAREPVSGSWSVEVSRVLREALEGYCTPEMCGGIVQAALARAGVASPPESPHELSEFVTNALSPEVERRLGEDAASELEQRMAMLIHVLSRASRPITPAPADASDDYGPEPASETRPVPSVRPAPPDASDEPELILDFEAPTDADGDAAASEPPPRVGRTAPPVGDRPTAPPPADAPPELALPGGDRPTAPPPADAPPELVPPVGDRPTAPPPDAPRAGAEQAAERPTRRPADSSGAITVSSASARDIALGVVSPDSKLPARARVALGDGGHVLGFRSLAELAAAEPGTLDVILVDRRGSAPSSVVVLPTSVRGAQIVLWPAKPEAAAALGASAAHVAGVSSYGPDVALEDVVVLVRLSATRG